MSEFYLGLVFKCPKVIEDEDCPLKELRKEPDTVKRLETWEKMSHKEKKVIIDHHRQCIKRKYDKQ